MRHGLLVAAAALLVGAGAHLAHAQRGETVPTVETFVIEPGKPPPLAAFTVEHEVEGVHLSPSGRYVATIARLADKTHLIIEDLTGGGQPTSFPLEDTYVHDFLWVTDDRVVYRIGSRDIEVDFGFRGVEFKGAPQYLAMNRDFTNIVPLLGKSVAIKWQGSHRVSVSMTGLGAQRIHGDAQHVIMPFHKSQNVATSRSRNATGSGGQLDLLKVNVFTGESTVVGAGVQETLGWMVDRAGNPVIRLDTNRRQTELRIMTLQGADNARGWRESTRWRRDQVTGKPVGFSPLSPGPSPELYYVAGMPPGADRMGVHLYDLSKKAYVQEVFTDPGVDVEGAFFDPATGAFTGATVWTSLLDIKFADRKLQQHYNALKDFFSGHANVHISQISDDESVWLLFVGGVADPGAYYLYDMKAGSNTALRRVAPLMARFPLGPSQTVAWTAHDGVKLQGYLTLPPNSEGKKPPLIAYIHGGPEARDYPTYNPVVQFLATRGYAVFQPNFRGSSGYGHAFAQSGRRQWGRNMQTDINDGVDHLAAQGLVDATRSCIVGASYGGYAAQAGITLNPERYQCGVSFAGVSDLHQMMVWERNLEGADGLAYRYWVDQIGDPGKDKAEMDRYSPIKLIDRIDDPLLLVHGKEDFVVPVEQSQIMEKAMKRAGKDVRYVEIKEGDHSYADGTLEIYLKELDTFLGKHLPVTP